jgi:hypothetical protein
LVGNSERKKQLSRPKHRCWDVKTDLKETGREDAAQIHPAQDREECRPVVKAVINFRVP